MRALQSRSRYARHLRQRSWVQHEFRTLDRLFHRGMSVPYPHAVTEHVILMDFVGDEAGPALPLHEMDLSLDEAQAAWNEVWEGIRLAWEEDLIHADLSPYNLLYDRGRVVFIDWPQVVDRWDNPNAPFLIERDLDRVCTFFQRRGVGCDVQACLEALREMSF